MECSGIIMPRNSEKQGDDIDRSREGNPVRVVYHPAYLSGYSAASCECPQRVSSIMAELSPRYTVVEPSPCSDDDILRCHSLGLLCQERMDPSRLEVAKLAAGGAILAAELALEGYVSFACVRPPGHHANPDHNWGFCIFNNMAVALKKLLAEGRIPSALVLDIDLHFGDGTDAAFAGSESVTVLNIQSSNPGDFLRETEAHLAAAEPSGVIGISAGFDQYEKDWGANLATQDYRRIGELAAGYASRCGAKIFAVLEGGYYLPDLGKNARALIEGMREKIIL